MIADTMPIIARGVQPSPVERGDAEGAAGMDSGVDIVEEKSG